MHFFKIMHAAHIFAGKQLFYGPFPRGIPTGPMDTKRWYLCTLRFDHKYSFQSHHKTGCTVPGALTVSRFLFFFNFFFKFAMKDDHRAMHNLDPISARKLTSRFPNIHNKGG